MEDIHLERTVKTPEVHFDSEKGELMIGGISIPENTVDFYHPLIYWITQYSAAPAEQTRFIVKFEYFNTSSSVVILNIFRMLSDLKSTVQIDWFYENDDSEMQELGEDYKRMLSKDLSFNLIPIDSF
ncbi:MAG: DUF1987 domain-containing protein [Parvicellaceae bacterium]